MKNELLLKRERALKRERTLACFLSQELRPDGVNM